MQTKSTTRKRGRKDTARLPDTDAIYTSLVSIFRVAIPLTRAQAKQRLGFLARHGYLTSESLNSVDQIELTYFIQKPEKKGGRKR